MHSSIGGRLNMALATNKRIDLKFKRNKTLSTEALAFAFMTLKR
jgi:hypothetical protein